MATRSKFRHVFGTQFKRDYCYDNIRATENAWDGQFIKANTQFMAVAWQTSGGGAFAVIPHSGVGRRSAEVPLFAGHTRAVLDFDFHPFNDNLIVSGSEDSTVKIWSIPEGGPTAHVETPLVTLTQHQKKVGFVLFHPSASNVLATAAMDPCVKIWDIEKSVDKTTLSGFKDLIVSIDWNRDGSLLGSTCRDKKIRLYDPRNGTLAVEADGHQGMKSSRFVFLHENRGFSLGFNSSNQRQFMLWDTRNMASPVYEDVMDQDTGLPILLYDYDTGLAFVGGKGEASIKTFDTSLDKPAVVSTFQGTSQQRGLCLMPKRALDVAHNEIMRILKLTRNNTVEPIRFENPRKDESFQIDLFPDTAGSEPALTADEFFAGGAAPPKLVSLNPEFAPASKTFQPFTFTPAPTPPASGTAAAVKPASGGSDAPAAAAAASEELAGAHKKVASLQAALAEVQAENESLKAENAALKAENESLKAGQ